jgi:hypothetical protein
MSYPADSAEDALTAPSLTALLGCHGNLFAIASRAWSNEELAVSCLDADTVYAVAEWALGEVASGDEGITLSRVAAAYGQRPSTIVGITEPVLAYAFDCTCLAADGASSQPDEEGDHVRFRVPETGGKA